MTESDVYRDLGYIPANELRSPMENMSDIAKVLDDKRAKNISLMRELDPNLVDNGSGNVTITILGRKIDFHPASDTFYLHSTQSFGYGIEAQVRKIQEYLKGKK